MSHPAFLSAVRTDPDDDTARLVYADWLDEAGNAADAGRAEFIRTQIALARTDPADPRFAALEDRENELLRAHETHWLGTVPKSVIGWRFERGFVAELAGELAPHSTRGGVTDRNPVTRFRTERLPAGARSVQGFLAAPWVSGLRSLTVDNINVAGDHTARVLSSPHLSGLTRLDIGHASESDGASALPGLLTGCPAWPTIRTFRLGTWSGSGKALVDAVAGSGVEDLSLQGASVGHARLLTGMAAGRLTRLELTGLSPDNWGGLLHARARPAVTHLGLAGLKVARLSLAGVVDSPACRKLVALDMNEARVPSEALAGLADTDFWPRCRELKLIRGQCPPGVMARLAKRPGPDALRVLKLGETGLRDEGVARLCSAAWAGSLLELDLMRNSLTDAACREIRDNGPFAGLRHLDIRTNGPKLGRSVREKITDAGLEALATAPCLSRLRHLNLNSLPITARGVDAVINSRVWRLAELDLGGTEIGRAGIEVLAKSPNLARLTRLNLSFVSRLQPEDLQPLAESPYLSPLCDVWVQYFRTTDRVRETFERRLGRRFHQ